MMSTRRLELACWVVTAVAAASTAAGLGPGGSAIPVASRLLIPIPHGARAVPPDTIFAAARTVAESDPFRFDRRPTTVSYRPELEGIAPPPKPPKPPIALLGLVGSVHGRWAALLDGVPGHATAALVHVGDTLAGLRVRRIGRDTVLVTGVDTTWRLTVRRAWQ